MILEHLGRFGHDVETIAAVRDFCADFPGQWTELNAAMTACRRQPPSGVLPFPGNLRRHMPPLRGREVSRSEFTAEAQPQVDLDQIVHDQELEARWPLVMAALEAEANPHTFRTTLADIRLRGAIDKQAIVYAKNSFTASYINDHLAILSRHAIARVMADDRWSIRAVPEVTV